MAQLKLPRTCICFGSIPVPISFIVLPTPKCRTLTQPTRNLNIRLLYLTRNVVACCARCKSTAVGISRNQRMLGVQWSNVSVPLVNSSWLHRRLSATGESIISPKKLFDSGISSYILSENLTWNKKKLDQFIAKPKEDQNREDKSFFEAPVVTFFASFMLQQYGGLY